MMHSVDFHGKTKGLTYSRQCYILDFLLFFFGGGVKSILKKILEPRSGEKKILSDFLGGSGGMFPRKSLKNSVQDWLTFLDISNLH